MGVKGTILLMKSLKITLTVKDATDLLEHIQHTKFNPSIKKRIQTFVDDNQILKKVEHFLVKNELSPFWIPTIQELGRYKGGYQLVKDISELGGLKYVRAEYAEYINRRYDFKKLYDLLSHMQRVESSKEIPQSPEIMALVKQSDLEEEIPVEEESDAFPVWRKSNTKKSGLWM